jgi:pyrroloquinoline-quinone synthase
VNPTDFREALLQLMEGKRHWAWPHFTSGRVANDRLHVHLEQEWEVYIRDFPVLLGRAFVQCPVAEVRQDLAENLYEEETGGLHAGKPHPELFLMIPRALGMDMDRFASVELLSAAKAYRALLHTLTGERGWEVGTAVSTLWIEGTPYERSLFDPMAPQRPEPVLEDHPLVRHHGLPIEALALVKAHREVEGDHRIAAWRMVLDHVPDGARADVVAGLEAARDAWLAYRDDVAAACDLTRS